MKIAVLPGDGIGTEIVAEAVKVLHALDLKFEMEEALVGGAAYEAHGHPLPESTLKLAKESDAILFGAVGDWKYDKLERSLRPEQAILGLRKSLGLFANFRPAICYEELVGASSLKPELISGLDILIIRELTGDIYFGQPRGRRVATDGHFPGAEEAFDTMRYSRPEIERIAHVAFQAARKRSKKVTSVDKSNVLETFQFWKDVVTDVHKEYPDVALDHMYVDNAAMQLVKEPKKFDVVVTGNMFGDILSDEASITDQWRHDIHPRENLDVQNIKDSQILYKMHQLRLFEEFYNTHLKQKVSQNYVYEDFTSQKDFFVSVFKDLKIDISDNYKFNPTLTKQQNESDLARIRLFKKNLNLEV